MSAKVKTYLVKVGRHGHRTHGRLCRRDRQCRRVGVVVLAAGALLERDERGTGGYLRARILQVQRPRHDVHLANERSGKRVAGSAWRE